MKRALHIILCLAASQSLASAALFVDQEQVQAPDIIADFSQAGLAQSFISNRNNNAGVGVFLNGVAGDTGTITFSLYSALPTNGGLPLATASVAGTAGSFASVVWPSPVAIIPGATYFFSISSADAAAGLGIGGVNVEFGAAYDDGQAYFDDFQASPDDDFAFRTVYETAFVPEPSSFALLGLGALVLLRRRA